MNVKREWMLAGAIAALLAHGGCGGGNGTAPEDGDTGGNDTTTAPAADDGLQALTDSLTQAGEKAGETADRAAATVKQWIDGYQTTIDQYAQRIEQIKAKTASRSQEEISLLLKRAEDTLAEAKQAVADLAGISKEEAEARKARIDKLLKDVNGMLDEVMTMVNRPIGS